MIIPQAGGSKNDVKGKILTIAPRKVGISFIENDSVKKVVIPKEVLVPKQVFDLYHISLVLLRTDITPLLNGL